MNALSSADSNYLNADVLRLGEDIEEEDEEEEEDVSSDPEEEDEDEGEETEEEEEEDSRHSVPPRIANAKDNADQARAPAHTACTTPGHTHFHPLALAQVCDYPMCAFMGEADGPTLRLCNVCKENKFHHICSAVLSDEDTCFACHLGLGQTAPPVDDEEMPSAEMPSPPSSSPPSTPKGNVNTQQVRVGDAHIP